VIDRRDFEITYTSFHRPSLNKIVSEFRESYASSGHRTRVIESGPASMGHDLRAAVAACNDGRKVWKDEKIYNVYLD
jgi:ferric-chelate reductase